MKKRTCGDDLFKRLLISTIADDASEVAFKYGLGIEIAEFCTAGNLDTNFAYWDKEVRRKMESASRYVLHAPFNELCPAAIDPKIRETARYRYKQTYEYTKSIGVNRMVVHSGYIPLVYYKSWFVEQSLQFWRAFMEDKPDDCMIFIENVLEDGPELICEMVKELDDSRVRICLDIGHANTQISKQPLNRWVEACAPYLGHVHLHNNFGENDEHNGLDEGTINMTDVLNQIIGLQPNATFTIETMQSRSSVEWLVNNGFLPEGCENERV